MNMSFENFEKQFYINNTTIQLNLLDVDGILRFSNDVVIDFSQYIGRQIYEIDDFIGGLEELISGMEIGEPPLHFPRVELGINNDHQKIFDCKLQKIEISGSQYTLWLLEDISDEKKFLQEITISQRSAVIENEMLEISNKNIALEKEIIKIRNKELERQQTFRNEFFSKASHEIRSPVNGIIGMVDALQDTASEEQKEYLHGLKFLARHLKFIVNDLLDLAKLEAGKVTTELIDFDLYELLYTTKRSFEPECNSKLISIDLQIDQDVPINVRGDSLRLSQILFNLVSNAVKFTSYGGVNIIVSVQQWNEYIDEFYITFEVIDTGKGIAENKLNTIFTPFSQEDISITRKFGGTGLGLTIVKQVVEVLNGDIWVSSEIGYGSTFGFKLPFGLASDIIYNQSHIDNRLKKQLKDARILVVDDSKINLMITEKYLNKSEVKLLSANSGGRALELLADHQFDIAIFDLEMPDMNGAQLLRKVKENTQYATMPILIHSGHKPSDIQQLFGRLDYDDILTKPCDRLEMLQKIAKNLNRQKDPKDEFKDSIEHIQNVVGDNAGFQKELLPHIIRTMESIKGKVQSGDFGLGKQPIDDILSQSGSLLHLIGLTHLYSDLTELTDSISAGDDIDIKQKSQNITNSITRFLQAVKGHF